MNSNQNISQNHGEIQQRQYPSPGDAQAQWNQHKADQDALLASGRKDVQNAYELGVYAVIGIVVAVVLCYVVAGVAVYCCIRSRNRGSQGPMGVQQPYGGAASQTPYVNQTYATAAPDYSMQTAYGNQAYPNQAYPNQAYPTPAQT